MKRYFAELIGTFVLVFAGVGSAVLAGDKIGYLGISLAFGLTVITMSYAVGPISGCHINPAVTFGMLLGKRINFKDTIGYWIAQVLGAIIGAALVLAIAQGAGGGYDPAMSGLAANGFGDHSPGGYDMKSAFLIEAVMTFILVFTALGATDMKAPAGFAGLAIGLALTLTNLAAIPVTNASINPARSIGPAVFVRGWALSQLWLFIAAPLVGGAVAAIFYRIVRGSASTTAASES